MEIKFTKVAKGSTIRIDRDDLASPSFYKKYSRYKEERAYGEADMAFIDAIPSIVQMVIKEFGERVDNRTLVIVLLCPCCEDDPILEIENAVLVSALKWIDRAGHKIQRVDKGVPFRNPAQDGDANNLDEYLESLKNTINRALES